MSDKLILIVEDEPKIAQILVDFLSMSGFTTKVLDSGLDAVASVKQDKPSAVILDLMLPHKDGLTICREVRQFSNVPILMLTARVDEIDRLNGLGIGADDYVCKPFSPREVVARVEAILRRTCKQDTGSNPQEVSYKDVVINLEKFSCKVDKVHIELTPVEFRLLSALIQKPGAVLSREILMTNCYDDARVVSNRTIDSHMKNLRTKLNVAQDEHSLIHSVYGIGYKME